MTTSIDKTGVPFWSLAGFHEGVVRALPLLPGTVVFGAAFAAIAAQKGLTLNETLLMNAFVFSGTSQLLAMEAWTDPMMAGTIVTLTALTLIANMRYVLIGASLRPLFGSLPAWQVYPVLCITCDSGWLITMRAHGEGVRDAGLYLGASAALWLIWIVGAIPGHMLGALISDPRRFGLDLVMPAFFVSLLVPMWSGPRAAIPWLVAGIVALLTSWFVPGWWFLIVGALAGSVAGGFIDDGK